jgi:LmbE family N-acetylglucosaminyl deacetylase
MTEDHRDTIQLVMDLLRENGLIVLALVALMWQVWMTNTTCREEATRWRTVIDGMRQSIVARDTETRELSVKWLDVLVSVRESMAHNAMIAEQALQIMKDQAPKNGAMR